MAKSRYIQTSFLSGELSPLIQGNIDLAQYYQGARQLSDVLVVPQGGAKRRGGLEMMDTTRPKIARSAPATVTMPRGGTPADINDGDDATSTSTTVGIATAVIYEVANFDFGSPTDVEFIDVRGLSINLVGSPDLSSYRFEIEYSDDGISWSSVNVPFIEKEDLSVTFDRRTRVDRVSPRRYWRLCLTGSGDLTTSVVDIAGVDFWVPNGDSETKLIDFSVTDDKKFVLSVTDGNITTYLYTTKFLSRFSGYNLKAPYTSEEVTDIRYTTTENVCLLFHENHPTQRIIFYDNDDGFEIDAAPYTNIPQFDFNDTLSPTPAADQQDAIFSSFNPGQTYQIDVEGILSKQITYAGDSSADEQLSTAFNMQKNLQDMPNFGETGVTVTRVGVATYRITIEGESADDYELFSGFNTSGSTSASISFVKVANGSPRKEDLWSANRGYPRMGAFFGGRLWLGGTRDKRQTLLASKSGSFLDFDTGEGADDEAIFTTITARNLTEITDIYPGRNLQVFTAGAEYAVLDQTITPSSVNLRAQTSNGSLYIPVQESDGAVVFADKNGKTLREYTYTFNEDSYAATDISVLSSHLIKTPVSMAFLNGTSSDDSNWLFIINSDGTAAVLNKLRAQDINAFTSMSVSTQFNVTSKLKYVETVGDQAFFVVHRYDANDNLVSTIERLEFTNILDCSLRNSPAGLNVSLDHLIGFEVQVIGLKEIDGFGYQLPSRTVGSGGTVTFTSEETAEYPYFEIGLNFTPTIEPMPANTNIGSGENFMRLKRVVRVNLRVNETFGLYMDGQPIPFKTFGSNVLNQPPTPYTGIIGDIYPTDGWERDEMPIFTCEDATPMHVQAIEFEVESS